jgi:hypothetical protein
MLLIGHNFRHFTFQEILIGTPEFGQKNEIRIIFVIHLEESVIEEAVIYYKNIEGLSSIEVLEMPCNDERANSEEIVENLKKNLIPLKEEADKVFKIFVLDSKLARV